MGDYVVVVVAKKFQGSVILIKFVKKRPHEALKKNQLNCQLYV